MLAKGPSPQWMLDRTIELRMGSEFEKEMRTSYTELLVFDNEKPEGDDIVGTARLDLGPLADGRAVEGPLEVVNSLRKKVGVVHVRAGWLPSH